MTKHEIRLELQNRMRCASRETRLRESGLIVQQLLAWEAFETAKAIGVYLPLPDEVDTTAIIEHAHAQDIEVAVPVYRENAYYYHALPRGEATPQGAFGVAEPRGTPRIRIAELDMLLLPGRGFDSACNRIGRGKGHIDTLLDGYQGIRVGLAFSWQIMERIPLEAHDQPLEAIVTPSHIFQRAHAHRSTQSV